MFEIIDRLFMLITTLVVMLGLGATQTWGELKTLWRAPRPVLIGLACQFGIMPLLGWSLSRALSLSSGLAVGLVLLGCSPGGLSSNILTYFARGNVGLSIVMTLSSTILAVVMMPLCTWLYARGFTSASLQIPYGGLMGGLVLMMIPVGLGLWVRRRSLAWAKRLESAASRTGILIFVYLAVTWFPKHQHLTGTLSAAAVIAPGLLTVLGYGLGYGASRLLGLSFADARTVSLETGTQNSVMTITMISLSFPRDVATELLVPPVFYLLWALFIGWSMTLYMRRRGSLAATPAPESA